MASDGSSKNDRPPALLVGSLSDAVKPSPAEKGELAAFLKSLSARIAGGRPFTCLIADDRELLRLNSTFLGHEYPTDVLSFPSQADPVADAELGEIAISIERAAAQAQEFGHAALDEVR